MNMKRIFAILLALCLMLCLCACGGQQDDKTTTEATTEASTTASTTEATTEAAQQPDYTVKVVDEAGNPIAGAMVQICQGESCFPGVTDENGVAGFMAAEGNYEAKMMVLPEGYTYASEEQVFPFADGAKELTITLKAVA